MLSVVIPIYNINCFPLVEALVKQFDDLEDKYEIICLDDASSKSFKEHEQFDNFSNVSFIKLDQNVGRSRIRNLLASTAKYNWLLFLDADTLPTHSNFIKEYLSILKTNSKEQVFFGGLAYRLKDVVGNNFLRYEYGKSRESISAKKRNKAAYTSLLMSNTLVKKTVFNQVKFNSNITRYGHEDALFSYDLHGASILVKHIDNSVFHTGLESDDIFIKKSKIAVENLWDLHLQGLIHPDINKLLRWFFRTKMFFLTGFFSLIYKNFNKSFERHLSKKKSSLLLFDLYRLSYLCHLSKMEK